MQVQTRCNRYKVCRYRHVVIMDIKYAGIVRYVRTDMSVFYADAQHGGLERMMVLDLERVMTLNA